MVVFNLDEMSNPQSIMVIHNARLTGCRPWFRTHTHTHTHTHALTAQSITHSGTHFSHLHHPSSLSCKQPPRKTVRIWQGWKWTILKILKLCLVFQRIALAVKGQHPCVGQGDSTGSQGLAPLCGSRGWPWQSMINTLVWIQGTALAVKA